jgi:hypothetical protein
MSGRTSSPAMWFWFGAYPSWAGALAVAALFEEAPGRWSGEAGLFMGQVASMGMAAIMSGLFAGWLEYRCWRAEQVRPHFAVPLVLGLLIPWLCVVCGMAAFWTLSRSVATSVAMVAMFGSPIILAEITLRKARRVAGVGTPPPESPASREP